MSNEFVSRQNNQLKRKSIANAEDQEKTKEQLSDVYAAGTSDGFVQLENETISLAQDSNESDNTSQKNFDLSCVNLYVPLRIVGY